MSSPHSGVKRPAEPGSTSGATAGSHTSNNTAPVSNGGTPARKKSRFTDAVTTPVVTNNNTAPTSTPVPAAVSQPAAQATTAPQSLSDKARAIKERVEALKRKQAAASNAQPTPAPQLTPTTHPPTVLSFHPPPAPTAVNSNASAQSNPYLPTAVDTQRSRPLAIHTAPGKHTAAAAAMRIKQLTAQIAGKSKNDQSLVSQAPSSVQAYWAQLYDVGKVVDVEWWDEYLLHDLTAGYTDTNIQTDKLTSHIYHPVQLVVQGEKPPPPPKPVPMTKKERRKVKKRLKAAAEQEKQDRIKLGLDAPPEPKLRIRNLHNSVLLESVADPTALEHKIKKEVADRKQKHLDDNKARQLSKDAKREKMIQKYTEDISVQTYVHVYRLPVFDSAKIQFKLNVNAQQYRLTGVCIMIGDDDEQQRNRDHTEQSHWYMLVAEGGQKALKRYNRLLTHRIDWTKASSDASQHDNEMDESDDDADVGGDVDGGGSGPCQLVWSGTVSKPAFSKFSVEHRTEYGARKLLERHSIEQYYQLVKNYKPD